MPGVWTKERRRTHSRRIKQLVKDGLYKKAMNRPDVLEGNRQRAVARWTDPEFRKKHRKACKIAMQRPEVKRKLMAAIDRRDPTNIILAAKKLDRRKKVSEGQKKNWDNNPQRKTEASQFKSAWWQSLSIKEFNRLTSKIMSSNGVSPNKSERKLIKIFSKLEIDYEFTGAGGFSISHHCPDFVDRQNKEVLEFNGIYWHKNRDADIKRAYDYVKKGYRCLIIYYEGVNKYSLPKILKAIKTFKSRYSPICMATCS